MQHIPKSVVRVYARLVSVSSRLTASLSNVTSEAVSRPDGSNVIFESRRNLLAMPRPSNVMEHNKYKSIIKPVLDERMVNLSNFTFLTLLEQYTFNPN